MTIWQRIVRLVRSIFTREPDMARLTATMDDAYRTQTRLLEQARRGYADVNTSRRRVEVQLTQMRQQAAELDTQAQQAVADGHDDTARAILGRKLALEKAEAELTERHAALTLQQEQLEASVEQVESDVEAFRVRRDTLTARHAAAEARAEINSATTGINAAGSAVGQAMSSAEQRTRELESTADAVDELVADGVVERAGEDRRAAELRRFDAEAAEVERQLEALHQKGNVSGPDPVQG